MGGAVDETVNKIGNTVQSGWDKFTGADQARNARKAAKRNADAMREAGLDQADAMRYQADVMERLGQDQTDLGARQLSLTRDVEDRKMDLADRQLGLTEQSVQNRRDIAEQQLGLGEEQMDIARERADLGRDAYEFGRERWQDYRDLYRPTEEAMLDMAGRGPQYDRAVSQAMADVRTAQGNEMDQNARMLQRYGMNPNSGRFAEAGENRSMQQAAQAAQAATKARRQEDTDAYNKMTTAMGRGQYLPGMSQQGFSQGQSGLGGASSSMGAASSTLNSAAGVESGFENSYAGAGQQLSGMNNLYGGTSGIYGNAGSAMQGAGNLEQSAMSGMSSAQNALQNNWNTAESSRQFNVGTLRKSFSDLGEGVGGAYSMGMFGAEGGKVDTEAARREAQAMDAGGTTYDNSGQVISGPGGPKDDAVPAQAVDAQGNSTPVALSDGEYVLPAEAVQFYGLDKLDRMVKKAQEAMKGRKQ